MAKLSKKPARKLSKKAAGKKTAAKKTLAKKTAAKKTAAKKPAGAAANGLMQAPKKGVTVRMYRQGHGDCFLLAFPGSKGKPVYVLIDCGFKPGSNGPKFKLQTIEEVTADIAAATGSSLDLVVVTHEHQDHVNGFGRAGASGFEGIAMKEAWFAWTEDPKDELANELRKRYHDTLLGLAAARDRLAARGSGTTYIDELLSLELGIDDANGFSAAAAAKAKKPESSVNKLGMKLIKDKAKGNVKFISPHDGVLKIPGVDGVKVHAFGPPRDADLISDEDPQGSEAFPGHGVSARASFLAAVKAGDGRDADGRLQPFGRRFAIRLSNAREDKVFGAFFRRQYGGKGVRSRPAADRGETPGNAAWRRIDDDWLYSAEELALVLNAGINNTSLVLAFEFEASKKVVFFVGDAQHGNWRSWTSKGNKVDGAKELVRDLMGRTVLYKVGHHGSHNATLNGTVDGDYPCLAWMGKGKYANEFAAMITAVNKWALAVKPAPWVHPLPSIKKALLEKTGGRLFQTDTPEPVGPRKPSDPDWKAFEKRTKPDPGGLYFDYTVVDE